MKQSSESDGLETFTAALPALRGELHRYLARMTGSVIDGEDLLQDALMSAAIALQNGADVENMRAWLFRIAHNTALNMFRAHKREAAMKRHLINLPPTEPAAPTNQLPEALTPYLSLSPKQRSAVILRDVFGYSAAEVADLTQSSVSAVKSALHRGRAELTKARKAAKSTPNTLTDEQSKLLHLYADLFNAHEFDRIRDMLSAEVHLELVSVETRDGKELVSGYYENYAKRTDWHMAPGLLEGQPAILAFDRHDPNARPLYFILLEADRDGIIRMRDFRYARYVMDDAEWCRF
jgi:RNA polymerase sigma-70 factor (ECF subfamily)